MAPVASPLIQSLETSSLPSLPHVLLRVLDACNSNETSFSAIAEIINKDAALSSKVIGASSSALYGKPNKITAFEQKLVMLGLDMVRTIAISSSVYQVFSNISSSSPEFDMKSFWGRSLTSATLAKLIAQETDYPHPEEAYLTGLLLDVGQLVLWSNFPKQYAMLSVGVVDDLQLMQRETEEIGSNHCEVGAWLAGSWHLNSFMADAVLYHHVLASRVADAHPLIRIAHVANSMSLVNPDDEEMLADGAALLGITPADSRRMIAKARELVTKIALSLEIEIDIGTGEDGATPEKPDQDKFHQKKMQLALEVRDIALVDGIVLGVTAAPPSLDGILLAIQRSLHILFGFQNIIFFLRDRESGALHGKSLAWQHDLVNEMVIPPKRGNSIVTDVLFVRSAYSSFVSGDNGTLTVLDDQIARLMQAEGFYCQPLISQDTLVGTMLFGLAKVQLPHVEKQRKLISMFAQQASQTLAAWHVDNEQVQRTEFEVMTASRAKARQVVHEANNPLSIIKNYIKLLSVKLPQEDTVQGDLAIIREEIDRVTKIIRQVTEVTEVYASPLEELNVNSVIQDLYKIFFESLFAQHQITAQTQLDPSLPSIVADRDKLKQVLINLMKNAAESMQEGGLLLISTRGKIIRDGNEYIEISLVDNGPGIPKHIMADLFKPVTSTKGKGHAGLGLLIVKNLVDELKGRIFCQSNEISGTAFQILLPVPAKVVLMDR
ncbi:similar to histidine kinase (C-terminus) (fusion protein) [Sulfuricella denitrificans skB26]|uniref:histidine kinase n=1 Tax=Sulfuricella denitrificans (strain DSM 22764 / NBRC 105220 / skB26) TaxID=1163617 RepID=S6AJ91_SULDS|nr:HDOD domain-containing protein [Sulfuricella denitrificans]BAN34619.1 similar to histidine kinase (C-terminus) (fusion protein) [Sulfuricella denitrificans skB26]